MKNITKILEVVDTREWIEVEDDRWAAVPGSGTTLQCESCGRDHEVHATVQLDDDTTAVVGTGCAKGTAFDKPLKSGANKAKTLARLRAQLAAKVEDRDFALVIAEEVAAMERPAVTSEMRGDVEVFRMGAATVWCRDGFTDERRDALDASWRRTTARELGAKDISILNQSIIELDRRISKRI